MAIGSGEITKREGILVVIALAFIGLVAAYWFMPHATKQTELAELEGRVERLTKINQRAAADLASGGVQQLQAEADGYAQMFEVLRQLVPQSNEVPTLLEQVSTAARREGLEISGIKPEVIIAGPEFDTYQYRITVPGGFHAIARFLTNVGSLSRIVTAVDVTLKEPLGAATAPKNSTVPTVSADFMIRTYVARSEPMPGTGATALRGGN